MALDNNRIAPRILVVLIALAILIYGLLAGVGELRQHLALFLSGYAVLFAAMLWAWRLCVADGRRCSWILVGALLFRIVAAAGPPALSDDVYRYVWDGRVQARGIHPYLYAPGDPALTDLRDDDWSRINHPTVKTIYPPLAEAFFFMLAALGLGPSGFRLVLGLADFGVILALGLLLRRSKLPRDRIVLYAWNPLAVLETAGSGHVEPLGVLLVVLACGWLRDRPRWSSVALAAGIQVKLVAAVLLPGHVRRCGWRGLLLLLAFLAVPCLIYGALGGPMVGPGLSDYAARWEHNAFAFEGLRALTEWLDTGVRLKPVVAALERWVGEGVISWELVYRQVWPGELARLIAGALLAGWVLQLARRRLPPVEEYLLAFGGLLLLAPTVHPWYLLWVLPFAAARLSWGWLLFSLSVALAYVGGSGDVPWIVRCVEYVPPLAVMLVSWLRARSR